MKAKHRWKHHLGVLTAALLCLCFSSCMVNQLAINAVSNALTGEGSADVFTSDSDLELVGDALPFAIKMYETLLAQNPRHQGLLITTGSLFIMYANAFVQTPADMLDPVFEYQERAQGLDRAKALYLRGYSILMRAFEYRFPGFSQATVADGTLDPILRRLRKSDVPLIYWTVAGGLAAYSINIFDFALGARIPEWDAMMARAYELDPDFMGAAINEFYILFYAALPEAFGGNRTLAEHHFNLAVEKTGGLAASPFVSWALMVNIPDEDYDGFRANLERALAIDPDENPSTRLMNILAQRRAQFLLDTAQEHFFILPF